MTPARWLARPLLAGIFVYGGLDAVRHPDKKVAAAEPVALPLAERLGISDDTKTLIQVNGAAQVLGGILLSLGKLPRVAAVLLIGSLVPTTAAGHRFWEETDPAERARQQIQFLKNAAMLGGLILAAVDTEGRPSVSWRLRRTVREASLPPVLAHLHAS